MISLFGYGITTKAIAKHLKECTIYDDNATQITKDDYGHTIYPSSMFDANKSDLEIPSPGIAPTNPLIQQAKHLISEYDFFEMPFSIWISGTNGKTTLTQMITHLLEDRGALSGGNIGTPLGDLDKDANIWVLETSSFTFHYTTKAKPNIYILLPISDDHSSWHGSFEEYEQAKLKPFGMMCEGDTIIAPKKYQDLPTDAHFIGYEGIEDLVDYFELDAKMLRFKGVFLLNALLALSVQKILFDTCDYAQMNHFVIDKHRQEEFYHNGLLFVDDSKATNISATIEALKCYHDKHILLIIGGDRKGAKFAPLYALMQRFDIEAFVVGEESATLTKEIQSYGINAIDCHTVERATAKIITQHNQESVALLSPASASLDQFRSYKERGESFKESVLRS